MNNAPRVPLSCAQVEVHMVYMSPALILTSPINTSQYILWAVSPSLIHSMISYWPEKLGCHGTVTLHSHSSTA